MLPFSMANLLWFGRKTARRRSYSQEIVLDEDIYWNWSENSEGDVSVPILPKEEGTTSEHIEGTIEADDTQVSTPFTEESKDIQDAYGASSQRNVELSQSYDFTPQSGGIWLMYVHIAMYALLN